jgi:hypothetical protein
VNRVLQYVGQGLTYAVFAVVLGYFANAPTYTHMAPEKALIKLGVIHGAQPKGECRELTREELAKLAPNMRKPRSCPRERLPVVIELVLDGKTFYRESLPPMGLSKDFPSHAYRRFEVKPGRHRLVMRLRDTSRTEGFDYERTEDIVLAPRQNLSIDFKAATGGFIVR